MTPKTKTTEIGQCAARGFVRTKSDKLSFLTRMAKRKAEDRAIERRRDERLAVMFKR